MFLLATAKMGSLMKNEESRKCSSNNSIELEARSVRAINHQPIAGPSFPVSCELVPCTCTSYLLSLVKRGWGQEGPQRKQLLLFSGSAKKFNVHGQARSTTCKRPLLNYQFIAVRIAAKSQTNRQ